MIRYYDNTLIHTLQLPQQTSQTTNAPRRDKHSAPYQLLMVFLFPLLLRTFHHTIMPLSGHMYPLAHIQIVRHSAFRKAYFIKLVTSCPLYFSSGRGRLDTPVSSTAAGKTICSSPLYLLCSVCWWR